jgi:hypothetical protein
MFFLKKKIKIISESLKSKDKNPVIKKKIP